MECTALLELAAVDVAVTPTRWQQDQFPLWMRDRFTVVHEGIDVQSLSLLRARDDSSDLWSAHGSFH